MKYYRLPRKTDIQQNYINIFKTDGWIWKNGHICCQHWKDNVRQSTDHLPEIIVPLGQLEKLKQLVEETKNRKLTNPTKKNKSDFMTAKNKLAAALRIVNNDSQQRSPRPRRVITKSTPPKKKLRRKAKMKTPSIENLQRENAKLKAELLATKTNLKEKTELTRKQQNEILLLKGKIEILKKLMNFLKFTK